MKGTLFVLVLLVTTELGFPTAEACPVFYEVFTALALGSKTLLDASLNKPSATTEEKEAFGKIQDCYNEAGIRAKILDAKAMYSITTSPSCSKFYGEALKKKITEIFEKFML